MRLADRLFQEPRHVYRPLVSVACGQARRYDLRNGADYDLRGDLSTQFAPHAVRKHEQSVKLAIERFAPDYNVTVLVIPPFQADVGFEAKLQTHNRLSYSLYFRSSANK